LFTRSKKKRAESPGEPPAQQADQSVPGPRESASGEAIPPIRDMEGGPDTPLDIGPTGWKNTLKRSMKKFSLDRCTMAAGSLAYHWFFALFPAVVAAIGVVSLVQLDKSQLNHLISGLGQALP
jgi:hypothetical protein